MSLASQVQAGFTRVGQEIKALRAASVLLASDQTVTAPKRFAPGSLLMQNAGATVFAEPYSDVNPPDSLMLTEGASPTTPAAGLGTVFVKTTDSRPYFKDDSGVEIRLDNTSVRDFSAVGALTVRAGVARVPVLFPCTVEIVAAMVNTAPTGASVIIDINRNGTTIFGTQTARPTIAAGAFAAVVGTPTVTALAAGDYLTVDIDQIGSTVAGSDLVVSVALRRTG